MTLKKTAKKETAAPAKKSTRAASAKTVKPAAKSAAKAAAKPVASNDPEENIKRFAKTSLAMNFVKAHNGAWNHEDWLAFISDVKAKGYFPIDWDRVGLILEDKKKAFFAK
ncbi:MAG: hypothetical protein PUC15_06590 [Lentisphaeria bacterium]|jgi:hypothetical protein|nr:hypothetical protein [Lentisphaeria bacterium]